MDTTKNPGNPLKWPAIIAAIHGAAVIYSLVQGETIAHFNYILGLLTIPFGVVGGTFFILLESPELLLIDPNEFPGLWLITRVILILIAVVGTIFFWIKCIGML